MFCPARAKCVSALFGCDSFRRLRVCLGGDRVTHRARAAPRPPSRPSLRSRQPWGNEIEKPNKFPDRWWNVVSVAVTLDMEQSKHIGRTGPLLTRTGLVAAFLVTAGVVAVERSAHADGIVRCWGYNAQGQCNPPADLGTCSAVAAGSYHTIALRSDSGVRCWGWNNYGQCNPPADLGICSAVAAGSYHTIALRIDGGVRCWGNNGGGQCNPPADLGPCSSIAGGGIHTIALRIDGGVRCWGYNYYDQCNPPADLGACSSVAGGGYHTIALQNDGGVQDWGRNNRGQCNRPADLGACSSIAGVFIRPHR